MPHAVHQRLAVPAPDQRVPRPGGITVRQRLGAFTQHLRKLMQQLPDVLARFPARVLGRHDGDQQGEQAPDDGVDAPGERPAGRCRQQHHQQRLQRQLRGENIAAVQEAGQQDGEQKDDGGLPDPAAQPVQEQVTHRDADGAAQAHLQHPPEPGLPGESQGNQ
jgi:hypothetical protein